MATTFSFTFEADVAQAIVDAFCARYGYQAKLPDESDNKQTPEEFTQQRILAYCTDIVVAHQADQAIDRARQQAIESATAKIKATDMKITS
jgi:hypothetical protein